MYDISVTFSVFQLDNGSRLVNFSQPSILFCFLESTQPENIPRIVVTLPVFQLLKPPKLSRFLQPLNMYDISVTLEVFQFLRPSRFFNCTHPAIIPGLLTTALPPNIPFIVVTFAVFHFSKPFRFSKLLQSLNMYDMFLTFLVSQLDRG